MKKFLFTCVLFLVIGIVKGQNLIPNPSFEDLRNLPIKPNPVNNFEGENKSGNKAFENNLNHWFSATKSTPDLRVLDSIYQKKCGEKYPDCDKPHTGNYCIGLVSFMEGNQTKAYREYLEIKLLKPLRPSVKTHIEFWLCRGRQAALVSNNIGCYFSKNKVYANIRTPVLVPPQFNIDTIINESTAQWVKIEGSIIPDQAYNFLTIGNFFNNENTLLNKTNAPPSNYSHTAAYYLIDDIKVWQDTITAKDDIIYFKEQEVIADQAFELPTIHFETNRSVLNKSAFPVLRELSQFLAKQHKLQMEIHGYTDSQGAADHNLKLSLARAKRIQDYLIDQGIARERLTIEGHGAELAIQANAGKADAAHRKVLFVLKEF